MPISSSELAVLSFIGVGAVLVVGGRLLGGRSRSSAVVWPLPDWPPSTVAPWRSGARTFGAHRSAGENYPSHGHAGVDLGPPRLHDGSPIGRAYGSRVVAPIGGVVDLVGGGWDGPESFRIELVTDQGRLVFGAVQKRAAVSKGDTVKAGQLLGWLGRYPAGSTMLHLEQHRGERVKWAVGEDQPAGLIDPRSGILRSFA